MRQKQTIETQMSDSIKSHSALGQGHYFQPLKRHIGARIEPILRKKSGFDVALLENWPQIVGDEMAQICTAFKINWPRHKVGETKNTLEHFPKRGNRFLDKKCGKNKELEQMSDSIKSHSALATLSIACEGLVALKIQHQADEIIEKINLFFGFQAIGKIKIIQKSLSHRPDMPPAYRALSRQERAWLEEQVCVFEDDILRASMVRFGENILATIDPRLKKSII